MHGFFGTVSGLSLSPITRVRRTSSPRTPLTHARLLTDVLRSPPLDKTNVSQVLGKVTQVGNALNNVLKAISDLFKKFLFFFSLFFCFESVSASRDQRVVGFA
jgi:hypothetical protein